jgi:hypothetical protein
MNSFRILLVSVLTLILVFSINYTAKADNDCNITLDRISNYWPGYIPSWVEAGVPIDFKIRASYTGDGAANAIRGLFKVSSPDGAAWQPMAASWSADFLLNYPSFFTSHYYESNDGQLSDTVVLNSFDQGPVPSFVTGSSEIAWIISIQVDSSEVGKTICLDSVSLVPQPFAHTWVWGLTGGAGICSPAWSGQKCFEILASCCIGMRGDANTLDLNYLVNHIFRAGPFPPCALEADLDGDGISASIIDLNYLINYKWRLGPPPVDCP